MFLSCIICSGTGCFIYTETSATSSTCFSVQFCTVCGVPDFTLCCFDCSFAVHIAVHIHSFTSIACTRDDNPFCDTAVLYSCDTGGASYQTVYSSFITCLYQLLTVPCCHAKHITYCLLTVFVEVVINRPHQCLATLPAKGGSRSLQWSETGMEDTQEDPLAVHCLCVCSRSALL